MYLFFIFCLDKLILNIFWVLIPKNILIVAENQYSASYPYAPRWPECLKEGVSVCCLHRLSLVHFWVSFEFFLAKLPSKRPLIMSLASDEILGLVLVRTRLARILKFDKIEIQQILPFLVIQMSLSKLQHRNLLIKHSSFLQDFANMGIFKGYDHFLLIPLIFPDTWHGF